MRLPSALAPALVLLGVAAGCGASGPGTSDAGPEAGPDAPIGCMLAFLGDKTQDPELTVTVLGGAPPAEPVADGGTVPLTFPPQGGRLIFAGVRATNVDPCGVQLTGVLRDTATQQVRLDSRTINLLPTGDGWGESDETDPSSFSNIPVCPNEWSATNIDGTPYQLEMTVADRGGRTVTAKLLVTPHCADPAEAAQCLCICQGGYVLGQTCSAPDGGADAGGGS